MVRDRDDKRAAGEQGHETWHGGLGDFHAKEAAKYAAKAAELEAAGKARAAARARKVQARNEKLAAKHGAALEQGYQGYQD